jgi:hypothetical protein
VATGGTAELAEAADAVRKPALAVKGGAVTGGQVFDDGRDSNAGDPAADADAGAGAAPALRQRMGPYSFVAHRCFACGQLNAAGLRLELHADGGRCWTETTIPAAFEGWEGITHGGIVSAIADEVMAWSLIGAQRLGFTARLEVDFRRPVPVDRQIRAEGWIEGHQRRRFDTRARITDSGTGEVLADARAIYLAARPAQEAALRERYDIRPAESDAG